MTTKSRAGLTRKPCGANAPAGRRHGGHLNCIRFKSRGDQMAGKRGGKNGQHAAATAESVTNRTESQLGGEGDGGDTRSSCGSEAASSTRKISAPAPALRRGILSVT